MTIFDPSCNPTNSPEDMRRQKNVWTHLVIGGMVLFWSGMCSSAIIFFPISVAVSAKQVHNCRRAKTLSGVILDFPRFRPTSAYIVSPNFEVNNRPEILRSRLYRHKVFVNRWVLLEQASSKESWLRLGVSPLPWAQMLIRHMRCRNRGPCSMEAISTRFGLLVSHCQVLVPWCTNNMGDNKINEVCIYKPPSDFWSHFLVDRRDQVNRNNY